jgi:hypothetical protein
MAPDNTTRVAPLGCREIAAWKAGFGGKMRPGFRPALCARDGLWAARSAALPNGF